MKLVMLGAGKMGSAIVQGWANSDALAKYHVSVVEPYASDALIDVLAKKQWALNPKPLLDNVGKAAHPADAIVIAIKPQTFAAEGAALLAPWVGPNTLVISIMAGINMATIAGQSGANRVIRAMPNTPGQIGRGITPIVAGEGANAADLGLAHDLLGALGPVPALDSEYLLDVASTISGSGPAYVFLLAEILADSGAKAGLPADIADQLARHTIYGSADLMEQSDGTPQQLRAAVTSPGGTTAAAIGALTAHGGVRRLMDEAVEAALARASELAASASGQTLG